MQDFFIKIVGGLLGNETVIGWVVGAIVTAVLGWLASLYARVTGKELDAQYNASLHSALTNGLLWAIQELFKGQMPAVLKPAEQSRLLELQLEYTKNTVPGAIKHFKLANAETEPTLEKLALTKFPMTIEGAASVAGGVGAGGSTTAPVAVAAPGPAPGTPRARVRRTATPAKRPSKPKTTRR